MKRLSLFFICISALLLLSGCGAQPDGDAEAAPSAAAEAAAAPASVRPDDGVIRLDALGEVAYPGCSYGEGLLTIFKGGEYTLEGSLEGGVLVNTDEAVTLLLNGVDIACTGGPALQLRQAASARLILADGSSSRLSSLPGGDGDSTGAALSAACDLTVSGDGALLVEGGINNGIRCQRALSLSLSELTVTAAGNGVKADGALTVEGGTLFVTAAEACLRSASAIDIRDGRITLCSTDDRGIHADGDVTIRGGSLSVDALTDAVVSQTSLTVEGGTLRLTAGNDALKTNRAAADIVIHGGDIFINAYRDPIDARGSALMDGGELLALGIAGTPEKPAVQGGMHAAVFSAAGAKGDRVTVFYKDTELASGTAEAYGYNVVLYCSAAPEAAYPLQCRCGDALVDQNRP